VPFVGPKLGHMTGFTTQSGGDPDLPFASQEEGAAVTYGGVTAGFEWIADGGSLGLVLDLGRVWDTDPDKDPTVSPTLSLYGGWVL